MTQHNDGGPAFPSEQGTVEGSWNQTYSEGMSLRDYFAARANEDDIDQHRGFYSCHESGQIVAKYTREQAKYRYADAMLEARKVQP